MIPGFERLWSGRRDVLDVCDACQQPILPGEGRVVLVDDQAHLITLCPGDYVRRLDAAVPKQWPAASTMGRRGRR